MAKTEYALILLLAVTFLFLSLIYPSQRFRVKPYVSILILLPGLALSGIIVYTDYFIAGLSPGERFLPLKGPLFLVYVTALVLYISISFFVLLFRVALMRSRILKNEIFFLLYGLIVILAVVISTTVILPGFFGNSALGVPGAAASAIGLMLLLHHAVFDVFSVDFKGFYSQILYWAVIFTLLFTPVFLLLRVESEIIQMQAVPAIGLSIVFFMYLFFVFTYLRPRLLPIFERKYRFLMSVITELFETLSEHSQETEGDEFWNNFILIIVNGLREKLDIQRINFYLYDMQTDAYISYYSAGRSIVNELDSDSAVTRYLEEHREILEKNKLYISEMEIDFTAEVIEFMDTWKLEIALPFYDHDEKLIGILFISDIPSKYFYSNSFYSVLELYRIQLQTHLANELMIDTVKKNQIIEHDRMVVKTIKSKIIPTKLHQIHNFRVSSMYINNSTSGGDYFDTIDLGRNRVGLFITDVSYSGIESGILSLEIYTVLHTPMRVIDAPEKLLALMNWVISTSRVTGRYAPSASLVYSPNGTIQYSNAGYRPLTIYNASDGTFTSYDTQGKAIGMDRSTAYTSRTIKAPPGSIGYFYSDGFEQAYDSDGKTYNPDRIKDIIRMNSDQTPASLIRITYSDFTRFISNQKQEKDVTLIIFRI